MGERGERAIDAGRIVATDASGAKLAVEPARRDEAESQPDERETPLNGGEAQLNESRTSPNETESSLDPGQTSPNETEASLDARDTSLDES